MCEKMPELAWTRLAADAAAAIRFGSLLRADHPPRGQSLHAI